MTLPFIYSNMSDMCRCAFVKNYLIIIPFLNNNSIQPLDLLICKCLVYVPNLEKYKNLLLKHLSSDTSNATKPACSDSLSSLWEVSRSMDRGSFQGTLFPRGTAAHAEAHGSSWPQLPLHPGHHIALPSNYGF